MRSKKKSIYWSTFFLPLGLISIHTRTLARSFSYLFASSHVILYSYRSCLSFETWFSHCKFGTLEFSYYTKSPLYWYLGWHFWWLCQFLLLMIPFSASNLKSCLPTTRSTWRSTTSSSWTRSLPLLTRNPLESRENRYGARELPNGNLHAILVPSD